MLREIIPVARRIFGEDATNTVKMKAVYACTLYEDPDATLDDLREAVMTLEDTARIARRVLGPSHPTTGDIVLDLQNARAALGARKGGDVASIREAVAAMTAGGA